MPITYPLLPVPSTAPHFHAPTIPAKASYTDHNIFMIAVLCPVDTHISQDITNSINVAATRK